MADFSYRVFRQDSDTLLAIADRSVVGKKFEEGELGIFVSPEFYHEKTCSGGGAKKLIKSATIVNAVGADIVGLLVKEKVVASEKILTISGIPHAQVVKV